MTWIIASNYESFAGCWRRCCNPQATDFSPLLVHNESLGNGLKSVLRINDDHGARAMSVDPPLVQRLEQRLSDRQRLPRPTVSPELSYGRHRGPAQRTSRIAAVTVALYEHPQGGWTIPLTLRPTALQHHGGQVCLPGGQLEGDESIDDAALREFEEELGIRPKVTRRCGELSPQYVYSSDNLVHPVVTIIAPPSEPWKPDPTEVEQVILLPLSVLLDDSSRTVLVKQRPVRGAGREVGRLSFRATAFKHQDHMIWGATALILDQLAQILRSR
jgi:8-oxo-dGTP pyrophosphatase MutT (NUDIX family)